MALTITASTRIGQVLPGFAAPAIVTIAFDNSYPTGGELCDLSAIFPNSVDGGTIIGHTLNDAVYQCVYLPGASSASGLIQVFKASGSSGVAVQASSTKDLSAMNGQVWLFFGR